ncbi:hypothetical protein FOL47_010661, partial [Perkinsus chesapeaki]
DGGGGGTDWGSDGGGGGADWGSDGGGGGTDWGSDGGAGGGGGTWGDDTGAGNDWSDNSGSVPADNGGGFGDSGFGAGPSSDTGSGGSDWGSNSGSFGNEGSAAAGSFDNSPDGGFGNEANFDNEGGSRDPFGGGGEPADPFGSGEGAFSGTDSDVSINPVSSGGRDIHTRLADTSGESNSDINPIAGRAPGGGGGGRGMDEGGGGPRDIRTPLADDFHFTDESLNPSFSDDIEFADPLGRSLDRDIMAAARRNGVPFGSHPPHTSAMYPSAGHHYDQHHRHHATGYHGGSHGLLGPNEALVSYNNPSFPSSAYLSVFDTARAHERGIFREIRPWRGHQHPGASHDMHCRTTQSPHTAGYTAPSGLHCRGPAGRCSVARLDCGYLGGSRYEAKTYFMFQTKADRDAFVARWRRGGSGGGGGGMHHHYGGMHHYYGGMDSMIHEGHPLVSFSSRFSAANQMVATKIVGHSGFIDVSDSTTGRHAYQLKCLRQVHAVKYKLFPPRSIRCSGGGGDCKGLRLRCARWSHGYPASAYSYVWLMFGSEWERNHMASWWG